MKNAWLTLSLLILFVQAVDAKEIDASISGSWYNPEQSGHGLSVEYLGPETTVIYWYVYDPDGNPVFLVIAADNDGMTARGSATIQRGMRFGDFDGDDVVRETWGTVTLTYNNCNSLTLDYDSELPGYGSGTLELRKLVSVESTKCVSPSGAGNYDATVVNFAGPTIDFGTLALLSSGELLFWAGGIGSFEVGSGTWQSTGARTFQFSATGVNGDGGSRPVEGTGLLGLDGLRAEFDGGVFLGTPLPSYRRAFRVRDLTGFYAIDDLFGNGIGSVEFRTDGRLFLSLDNGCSGEGTLTSPNERFNQFRVAGAVAGCDADFEFAGLLTVNFDPSLDGFNLDVAFVGGGLGQFWRFRAAIVD